jgi:hypothetical protein
VIGVLALGTGAIKAAGPVAVGGRELSPRLMGVVALLAPVLLGGLLAVETFVADGHALVIDARAAGLATAAAVIALTNSLTGAVVGAAAATALVRLATEIS